MTWQRQCRNVKGHDLLKLTIIFYHKSFTTAWKLKLILLEVEMSTQHTYAKTLCMFRVKKKTSDFSFFTLNFFLYNFLSSPTLRFSFHYLEYARALLLRTRRLFESFHYFPVYKFFQLGKFYRISHKYPGYFLPVSPGRGNRGRGNPRLPGVYLFNFISSPSCRFVTSLSGSVETSFITV